MSEKSKKFSEELDRLVLEGEFLSKSIYYDCISEIDRKTYLQKLSENFDDEDMKSIVLKIPTAFKESYQSWYSKAQAVVNQILPDRLADFMSYYEYPRARKDITHQNYMIRDYLQGLKVTRGYDNKVIVGPSSAISEFKQQLNIVKAAKDALDSRLMDLSGILQADLFDSEIEEAGALAKNGHLRAAGAICGVVIEKHLQHICGLHNIKISKKNPTINNLSQLLRSSNVIDLPQERFIQILADIRNICDHAKANEPTKEEISDLVKGTNKVLKTVF